MATNAMTKYKEFETDGRNALTQHVGDRANIDELMSDIALAFSMSKNGALFKAVQTDEGKRTAISAVKLAVSQGLSLNPAHRECSLIPYGNTVQLVPEKAGYIKKAISTNRIKVITTDIVYKNDEFELSKSAETDDYTFKPNLDDRGEFRGAFTCIVFTDGVKRVEYMSAKQGEEHRSKWGEKNPLWKGKTFPQMVEKTTLIYACKRNNIAPAIEMHRADVEQYIDGDGVVYDVQPEQTAAEELAEELTSDNSEQADGDRF